MTETRVVVEKFAHFEVTRLGLKVVGSPTVDQWRDFGIAMFWRRSGLQWAIGDWCNYGEKKYSEKYDQALAETPFEYGTLRNFAWVASVFPMSLRVTSLSWSHHAAVANKELSYTQRDTLLIAAESQHMTRDELAAEVKRVLNKPRMETVISGEYTLEGLIGMFRAKGLLDDVAYTWSVRRQVQPDQEEGKEE